ncbi:zinc ribbon domain-containing protein [Enterococcus faecalis]|uniref:zinc ribbon domain-containing protein n=1 Tax=Enterococcus faecalis TaxID=1351 RepID=UPI0010EEAE00|nr:zinc ribbon domain-containing protein [Enterococcus faecalis]EAE2458034.1 zinc ribbon domain-containing protein [Listeria monocytogenes]EAE2458903.1 zinc ribbon domain-containing protein [Listeria monocytogenes]HAC6039121.1 zinc ribbon domain-containing protein [Listeria monocytogenes]
MGIQFVSVKCPECGAALNIEEGREQIFCSYCGTKIMVHNDNEHIYRHIDEAGIKQAETERIVKMKQMELAEKKRLVSEKMTKTKIKISLILAVVGILMMSLGYLAGSATGDSDSGFYMISMIGFFPLMGAAYIWLFSKDKEDEDDFEDKAKVPSSISDYQSKNYSAIEAMLSSAGFTNIKCVPLNDLSTGWIKKPDTVESITINGHEVTSGGRKFPRDSAVVISYHSFSRR